MGDSAYIRLPKQKRGIEKKQLIVDTARELYCENGYHNTPTNEIAKRANVSIGAVYSYFQDKKAILMEVADQFNADFFAAFDFIDAQNDSELFRHDARKWLCGMIERLIALQESQRDIYREIETLRYSVPDIAAELEHRDERVRFGTLEFLRKNQGYITCADIEATSIIIADFTGTLVDMIVVGKSYVGRRRLIDTGVDILYKMIGL